MTTALYSPRQLAGLLDLPTPTPDQAAVIAAPLRPLVVIAGAGSGKSETMAGRLVYLVANGMVRPEHVLGLTFTRKAAAELTERVRARLDSLRRTGLPVAGEVATVAEDGGDPLQGDPVISTYHSYAGRLVADHALREALEPSLRLITPAIAWQIAARVVAGYGGPVDAIAWGPIETTAAMLALAGELAEHLRTPQDVQQVGAWLAEKSTGADRLPASARKFLTCQRTREQLLPMVSAFARAKASREMIDYGDQIALAARIASGHPAVGAAERARYQVVLLDEYQDTSHAQLVLLRSLFGGGHPVTAVGDPRQSIYGWRGASAGNLARFRHDFPVSGQPGSPAPVRTLGMSFRNSGRVLRAAARIGAGLREGALDLPDLVPRPDRGERGAVVCALLESAADEARWVGEQIETILSLPPGTAPDGGPWPERAGERVRPADIAVLVRKRAQFAALRAAIEQRGIPVEVVGLGGLLIVPEVADVVATLRVLHDPTASNALARLLTGPRWRIGPRDLMALGRRARELAREAGAEAGAGRAAPASPARVGPPSAGEGNPAGTAPADPLAEAAELLMADPGSLVEALDDLGDHTRYSEAGHTRLAALAAELRTLRGQAGRSLPDLVSEVERVMGLDIEVAAQPGRDPAFTRADLDAFVTAAAAFADGEEAPTLGAFLAYLRAAEEEEFGLELGRSSGADAVTLMTVHQAKGLEWPAVFVTGLSAGVKSQVFPARPRVTTRWSENPRLLPFPLRGDAGDLPRLAALTPEAIATFEAGCQERDLAEERRLAYVAVTRAAFWLGCSGYWWGEGVSVLGPSAFLEDVRAVCQSGEGAVDTWTDEPAPEAGNPSLAEPVAAVWPARERPRGYDSVVEAAALVEQALAVAGTAAIPGTAATAGRGPSGRSADAAEGLTGAQAATARAWERESDLLLAELAARRGAGARDAVVLPTRLSVSALVTMAADPSELAQRIRRPMPVPPAPRARQGTAFHRWLECRFGQQRLLDPADLLGAADDDAADDDAADLAVLQSRFESGEWGGRWPLEVEVPFETLLAGRSVRGRIDAVFADGDGYDVVDWKTGTPPAAGDARRAVAVQLAAYRLAWSKLTGTPLAQVRAAFYYVREDLTVRPADLLDEAGLAALIEQVPLVMPAAAGGARAGGPPDGRP